MTGSRPTRVRWGILLRTGMGCMTWRGTCGSGVGIGIRARITAARPRPIRKGHRQARTACFGAAVGTATPATAGQRTAAATTRRTGTSTAAAGSVVSEPQVSELKNGTGTGAECWRGSDRRERSERRLTRAGHGARAAERGHFVRENLRSPFGRTRMSAPLAVCNPLGRTGMVRAPCLSQPVRADRNVRAPGPCSNQRACGRPCLLHNPRFPVCGVAGRALPFSFRATRLPDHASCNTFEIIAIIAHVDHGKTTLVDCLLKQSGTFRANQAKATRGAHHGFHGSGAREGHHHPRQERRVQIQELTTSTSWTRPVTPTSAARSSAS